eukprot:13093996-Alexandrium_andersonii.AAC.1
MHRNQDTRTHRRADTQTQRHAGARVHRHTCTQAYRHAGGDVSVGNYPPGCAASRSLRGTSSCS